MVRLRPRPQRAKHRSTAFRHSNSPNSRPPKASSQGATTARLPTRHHPHAPEGDPSKSATDSRAGHQIRSPGVRYSRSPGLIAWFSRRSTTWTPPHQEIAGTNSASTARSATRAGSGNVGQASTSRASSGSEPVPERDGTSKRASESRALLALWWMMVGERRATAPLARFGCRIAVAAGLLRATQRSPRIPPKKSPRRNTDGG